MESSNYKRIWAITDTNYLVGEMDNKLFFTIPAFIDEDAGPKKIALTSIPSFLTGQAGGYRIIRDEDLTEDQAAALRFYLDHCEIKFQGRPPVRPDRYKELCQMAGKEVL